MLRYASSWTKTGQLPCHKVNQQDMDMSVNIQASLYSSIIIKKHILHIIQMLIMKHNYIIQAWMGVGGGGLTLKERELTQ